MNKNAIIGIIVLIAIVSLGAIIYSTYQPDSVADEDQNTDDVDIPDDVDFSSQTAFKTSANSFAFNLIKQFNEANNENSFFSPYSIFTALAMAYEGAVGNTADEMADTLNIPQDNDTFHDYVSTLYETLNTNTEYNISTANAAWIQHDFPILQSYLDTVENNYHAESTPIDFTNPNNAASIINNWVENKTNNLIEDLISPGAISPTLTKLILTNAIYFKGIWEIQFDEANTTDREFTLTTGETKEVETMCMVDTMDTFNYTETDQYQALQLPYEGDDLSMIIMLPKDDVSLATMITDLSEESYTNTLDSMQKEEVDIYLPTFNITTPLYSLSPMLKNLGITDAFDPMNADFSGITGSADLYIQSVVHKGFISVDEEGTEAAAATGVVFGVTSWPGEETEEIVFDCDHPFLYLIQHQETGTILFMGTMDDPSQ